MKKDYRKQEIQNAFQLLGLDSGDNIHTAKIKFRKLMRKYHPDAVGSDSRAHVEKAQELNAAYALAIEAIRESGEDRNLQMREISFEINPDAFAERNIYDGFHMDTDGFSEGFGQQVKQRYRCIARGKYYWDPEKEEFSLYLKSIHHVVLKMLQAREEEREVYDEDLLQQIRFPYQVRLFELLGQQFINPVQCLQKLADPESVDEKGREIYRFRAMLGSKNNASVTSNIKRLTPGDRLYPDALQNNRILVSDGQRKPLGALSLEEDELYFCLIPLIRSHAAQVRMEVDKVDLRKKCNETRAFVHLQVRVSDPQTMSADFQQNDKILEILKNYEAKLIEAENF